jgi:hypothetical protein
MIQITFLNIVTQAAMGRRCDHAWRSIASVLLAAIRRRLSIISSQIASGTYPGESWISFSVFLNVLHEALCPKLRVDLNQQKVVESIILSSTMSTRNGLLPEKVPKPFFDGISKDRRPVLRTPNDVVLTCIRNIVVGFEPVCLAHASICLTRTSQRKNNGI